MKIKQKLTILFLVITVVSILTVAIISFNIAKNTQETNALDHLNIIADLKVDKIETFFNERTGDIKTAQGYYNIKTNLPVVDKFKNDRNSFEYLSAKVMLGGQLKVFQEINGYLDIMLVNLEGEIVYATNEAHSARELDRQLPGPGNIAFQRGSESV